MTPPEKSSTRITNKDVYDLFSDLKQELELVNQKLDTEIKKKKKITTDHEERIRSLEKLVWTSSWISSAVSTVITALVVAFLTGKL